MRNGKCLDRDITIIGDSVVRVVIAVTDEVLYNNKLNGLIYILLLFNMVDGLLTIAWVESGRAVELNPLMDYLIGIHPVLFMAIKLLLVSLGSLLIWRYRDRFLAVASLYLCVTAYSLLMLYHGGALIS